MVFEGEVGGWVVVTLIGKVIKVKSGIVTVLNSEKLGVGGYIGRLGSKGCSFWKPYEFREASKSSPRSGGGEFMSRKAVVSQVLGCKRSGV